MRFSATWLGAEVVKIAHAEWLHSKYSIPPRSSVNVKIHLMANIESILQQLRDERDRLDRAINALSPVSRTGNGDQTVGKTSRRFSAAAISKMRAAQRARRARESGQTHSATNDRSRPSRRISPEGLARISAAQRARCAKVRTAQKK